MKTIDTAAGPVEAHITGDGARRLLVLHPLGLSGSAWDTWAAELAERGWQVIAPTLPAGTAEDVGAGTSIATMASHAAGLLDGLGGSPVAVAGLSMGGCIALQLCLDRPDLVESLVLADTSSDYGPDRVESWEARAVTAASSSREELLDFQVARWFMADFATRQPEELDRLLGIFVRTPASRHAASCRALGAFTCTDRLGEIACPTLVLVGEEDFATPRWMAEAIADGVAGARFEVLAGVRHFSLLESAAARGLAEDFLTR